MGSDIEVEQRVCLLAAAPGFGTLPEGALRQVATLIAEERYPAGSVVVTEGEEGDRLYLVVEGWAEVSVASPSGPVPLASLGPGELFGEIALLDAAPARRSAT